VGWCGEVAMSVGWSSRGVDEGVEQKMFMRHWASQSESKQCSKHPLVFL
jgi:hypothetical protein